MTPLNVLVWTGVVCVVTFMVFGTAAGIAWVIGLVERSASRVASRGDRT
jgi:hypothetical protein